jgi:hypothetical protein
MNNLLALLVSLAMMLTGATMPAAEDAQALHARTMVIDNITVEIGDNIVALEPTAVMAIQTDGDSAAFDFYIQQGENRLLPFQATVDDAALLVKSDATNTTVKITAEEIAEMFESAMPDPDEAQLVQHIFEKLVPAYARMLELVSDPEQTAAFKAQSQAIYDEMIDRGEGVEERLYYEGDTMLVTTYEYDLDAAQIGRLADAIFASNEVMTEYADAYFDLIAMLPEDSGIAGAENFEALYEKLGTTVDMHVVESVAESGLRIMDSVLTIDMEQLEQPMEYNIHSEQNGDQESQTMDTVMTVQDMNLEISADITRSGMDWQGYFTVIGNPAVAKPEETDQGETEAEADELPEAEDVEDDDFEGEGDAEDALYFNCSFEYAHEQSWVMDYSFTMNGVDLSYSVENEPEGENGSVTHVSGYMTAQGRSFGCNFDAHEYEQGFDIRINEDEAISKDEVQPDLLLAGLGSDVLKLYTDPGIQEIVGLYKAELEKVYEDTVEVPDEYDDEEDYELQLGDPEFGYLPEGYAVTELIRETYGPYISVTLSNEADGGNIYVDLSDVMHDGDFSTYVLAEDGSYEALDGMLVNVEDMGDISAYSADGPEAHYYIVPDGGDISEDDIMKLIAGIRFN